MQNLDKLKEAIVADFIRWNNITDETDERSRQYREQSIKDFAENLTVESGNKKYLRVITKSGSQQSVWGFIVNTHDDSKFRYGDILKAAGWKAPAKNQARGNVVDGDFSKVQWTGPEYLR